MIAVCKSCGGETPFDESEKRGDKKRVYCKTCGEPISISEQRTPKTPPAPDYVHEPPTVINPDRLTYEEDEEPSPFMEMKKLPIQGLSIKSKLTMVIVLLVLLSLSAAGYMAISQSRAALSSQAENHLLQHARQKSEEYGITFNRIQDEVLGVADYAHHVYERADITSDIGVQVLMPWSGDGYGSPALNELLADEILALQRIGSVIKSIVANNPFLSLGYYGTETGMTVFDNEEVIKVIEGLEEFDVTARPWYASAKDTRGTIWTEPYIDANTRQLVVTCATPVHRSDGSLAGVVGFDVLLDTIQNDILTLDIGYQSYAFLVNQRGNVLVRPGMGSGDARWDETYKTDDLLRTSNPSFNRIIARMTRQDTDVESYSAEEGIRYIAYAPITAINASMGIVASRDEVIRPADAIQRTIIMILLAVLAVSVGIGLLIGNSITRPINELTVMADLISQGKMDLDVLEESRKDEIGLLTRSFNRLVMSLRIAMTR